MVSFEVFRYLSWCDIYGGKGLMVHYIDEIIYKNGFSVFSRSSKQACNCLSRDFWHFHRNMCKWNVLYLGERFAFGACPQGYVPVLEVSGSLKSGSIGFVLTAYPWCRGGWTSPNLPHYRISVQDRRRFTGYRYQYILFTIRASRCLTVTSTPSPCSACCRLRR